MLSGASYFFFFGLALAMIYIYLGIRREWGSPRRVVLTGVLICGAAMALVQATNANADMVLAIIYGAPLGIMLGLVTAGIAWYFKKNEARANHSGE